VTIQERSLEVADRRIGAQEPVYIIAEIGLNHNGDLRIAKQLVDAAIEAGADAVKFQKRRLRETYQEAIVEQPRHGEQGLQYIVPLLVEFELSDDEFRELRRYCVDRGATFLCTPWDRGSVDFLETLDIPAYKIGSPDMTNFPLIEYVLETGKPLLMSTGMSSEDEIRRTLAFLAERDARYALFHCVSTYPASAEEINLRFMSVLKEWSGGAPVGYSGHDTGTAISLAAVAMGARLLERHLTLDRTMRGPDHAASLEPAQFAEQVRAVREVELALGVAHRWMTRGEMLNRRTLAKSLVAACEIPAGTLIDRRMVTSKSPGMGLSPQSIDQLIGRRIARSMQQDEMFSEEDLVERRNSGRVRRQIDVGAPWGIVARFTDVETMVDRFGDNGMAFIEFHVSDRDLDAGVSAFGGRQYPFGLVVHAPEYCHDQLIDLCSADEAQRQMSIERIQKTIDLTRAMASHFESRFERGPKIVMHVGGMSPRPGRYDVEAATGRLLNALRRLDHEGVDLLLENLPPFPWYFGGKWFGFIATDADNTERLCRDSGLGLCFDTSHAALECARSGASLTAFGQRIAPYVRHLHVSDGAGVSGEGLQIGEGDVNFVDLLPVLLERQPTLIPEIWMGHHNEGRGFRLALDHLSDLAWAGRALARRPAGTDPELSSLTVPVELTVLGALQAIDANQMGIAFVVDLSGVVLGVLTDGDIRHALVRGKNLHTPVAEVMTREFRSARAGASPEELLAQLPGRTRIMPIVDDDGRLVDFASDARLPMTASGLGR
jgi:N-acetylneuraminate synthase